MERRRLFWLLSVPLMAAGSLLAHAASYWLVAPNGHERLQLLEQSGHGYLVCTPCLFAICLTLVLVGVAAHTAEAIQGRTRARVSAWPFALLPVLAFVVQEHLERLLHTGTFPVSAALAPTFLVGLLFQLPFALGALVLARVLVAAATTLGEALADRRRAYPAWPLLLRAPALDARTPRIPALASGAAERAPPIALPS